MQLHSSESNHEYNQEEYQQWSLGKFCDCAATCVAGTDAQSSLFMPVMPAITPTGTSTAEQGLPLQQQKQSLQLALHKCNLQLETIGLNVLAQEVVDVSNDDKPKLQKMLQASTCIFQ